MSTEAVLVNTVTGTTCMLESGGSPSEFIESIFERLDEVAVDEVFEWVDAADSNAGYSDLWSSDVEDYSGEVTNSDALYVYELSRDGFRVCVGDTPMVFVAWDGGREVLI